MPDQLFPTGQTIRTTFTTGIRDDTGTVLPGTPTFDVVIRGPVDSNAPAVIAVAPADGAAAVGVDASVQVRFNESVNPVTVTPSAVQILGPVTIVQVALDTSRTMMTIRPTALLDANTQYGLRLSGITDLAGNAVSGFGQSFFTTGTTSGDTNPPVVVGISPPGGNTNAPINTAVALTFNEPLLPTTINANNFALFANGARLSTKVTPSVDNTMVTLTAASGSLPSNSVVTVVATRDVKDLAGNRLNDFASLFITAAP
ncbi:MAG: Ig-like domain-containing protein [Verrucomicrobia bacterium]|nr:Ig-like domain-containing protein [Verrucomicrobiota bacterium]